MRRLWLIFSQAATVGMALLFVIFNLFVLIRGLRKQTSQAAS